MHMKRVLIASDDAHTRALVACAMDALDVVVRQCPDGELVGSLRDEDVDLVVLDGSRDPEPLVQIVETAVNEGLETRLLLLVEPETLPTLRVPTSLPSDFVVRGAGSGRDRRPCAGALWPGEEASSQELVRVDDLTINLATYQAYCRGRTDRLHLSGVRAVLLPGHPPQPRLRPRGAPAKGMGFGLLRWLSDGGCAHQAHPSQDRAGTLGTRSRPSATSATSGTARARASSPGSRRVPAVRLYLTVPVKRYDGPLRRSHVPSMAWSSKNSHISGIVKKDPGSPRIFSAITIVRIMKPVGSSSRMMTPPPLLTTRAISSAAPTWSLKWWNASETMTASALSSSNGMSSAVPRTASTLPWSGT